MSDLIKQRRVIFTIRENFERGGYDYKTKDGYFHEWGLDKDNQTVGIVETTEGEVCMVYPPHITFLTGGRTIRI